jgi:hypothetical protein
MAQETDGIVFRQGEAQHFMRLRGERASRLVYRGELMDVRR